jgi:hypothetical protein
MVHRLVWSVDCVVDDPNIFRLDSELSHSIELSGSRQTEAGSRAVAPRDDPVDLAERFQNMRSLRLHQGTDRLGRVARDQPMAFCRW